MRLAAEAAIARWGLARTLADEVVRVTLHGQDGAVLFEGDERRAPRRHDVSLSGMQDWRLQGQERYLTGAVLTWAKYVPPRADWDHDHCEFCSRKFSLRGEDLQEGYTTRDRYRWICGPCFVDFKEQLRWTVSPGAEDG